MIVKRLGGALCDLAEGAARTRMVCPHHRRKCYAEARFCYDSLRIKYDCGAFLILDGEGRWKPPGSANLRPAYPLRKVLKVPQTVISAAIRIAGAPNI